MGKGKKRRRQARNQRKQAKRAKKLRQSVEEYRRSIDFSWDTFFAGVIVRVVSEAAEVELGVATETKSS